MKFLDFLNEGAKHRYQEMFNFLEPIGIRVNQLKELSSHEAHSKEINDIVNALSMSREYAKSSLTWALQNLRRQDRITWMLRYVKLYILAELEVEIDKRVYAFGDEVWRSSVVPQLRDIHSTITKNLHKIQNPLVQATGLDSIDLIGQSAQLIPDKKFYLDFLDLAEELFAADKMEMGQHDIEFKSQTPVEMTQILADIKNEYKEKLKQLVSKDSEDSNETIILEFPDGSAWVDLGVPFCDEEGRAMGHCGNRPSHKDSHSVLSYRTIEKTAEGEMWKPRLTFILDRDTGLIGERKGRANTKPNSKYHGVIIDLLKLPIIKGLADNKYEYGENNFEISDLPDSVRDKLVKKKPELNTLSNRIKTEGLNKETRQLLADEIKNYYLTTGYHDHGIDQEEAEEEFNPQKLFSGNSLNLPVNQDIETVLEYFLRISLTLDDALGYVFGDSSDSDDENLRLGDFGYSMMFMEGKISIHDLANSLSNSPAILRYGNRRPSLESLKKSFNKNTLKKFVDDVVTNYEDLVEEFKEENDRQFEVGNFEQQIKNLIDISANNLDIFGQLRSVYLKKVGEEIYEYLYSGAIEFLETPLSDGRNLGASAEFKYTTRNSSNRFKNHPQQKIITVTTINMSVEDYIKLKENHSFDDSGVIYRDLDGNIDDLKIIKNPISNAVFEIVEGLDQ